MLKLLKFMIHELVSRRLARNGSALEGCRIGGINFPFPKEVNLFSLLCLVEGCKIGCIIFFSRNFCLRGKRKGRKS